MEEEEVWLDEDQQELVEKLKMEILEERRNALGEHRGRGDEVRGSRRKHMSRIKTLIAAATLDKCE